LHAAVLALFGGIRFSKSVAQPDRPVKPTAEVRRAERLRQAVPIIPKPKIKRASAVNPAETAGFLPVSRIVEIPKAHVESRGSAAGTSAMRNASLFSGAVVSRGVELFGSFSGERKVCYVVDCSGSMRGVFRRVQRRLKESVGSLEPDQYFYIIFFGGDKVLELGGGRLLRATRKAKAAACVFIDSVKPAGRTNAVEALGRAVQICDAEGAGPSVIYFLTDGFELTTKEGRRFSREISDLRERFSSETRINTVGFWPESGDGEVLEAVARQSGGKFVVVGEEATARGPVGAGRGWYRRKEGGQ
jgi:hypothetical protein